MSKDADLDDLLESALDDLEKQEKEQKQPYQPKSAPSPKLTSHNPLPPKPTTSSSSSIPKPSTPETTNEEDILSEQFATEMRKLMAEFGNGDLEKTIREMQNLAAGIPPSTTTSSSSTASTTAQPPIGPAPPGPFEENIANTLKMLAENAKADAPQGDLDPAAMDKLMEQFENNKDFQNAMEGMVQQLISKDILYDPMKELREKYPGWLKENEKKLSEDDYRRYIKQYEIVQKICTTYESNSESLQDVIALMQEMADCGQPPQDIIQDLAPGVQFGADGMPLMPGQDASSPGCSIM